MATARPLSFAKSNATLYKKPMWRTMATAVNQQNNPVTTITEDKGFGSRK
jgi:NADH dehydrogenase (ubiquinone) Fe-S protein 2